LYEGNKWPGPECGRGTISYKWGGEKEEDEIEKEKGYSLET